MMKFLRGLSNDTKRKVAAFIAALIAIALLIVWLLYSFGTFGKTIDLTKEQSGEFMSLLDQKVEIAYNAFTEVKDKIFIEATTSSEEASSTATTTVN